MKYDVFISYSRKDYVDANKQVIPGNIVSQIKALFDKNGISYWFDEEGIYSGDAFARVIARNIKASKMLLFISTANSNQSQWTSDEIAVAREYGKKIIPFRYDQSHYNEDVIIYIARLDYIDYLANPKVALNRLLSSVKEFLQTESQKEIEKKRAEEQRIMEEQLRQERAKRVEVIDSTIAKHNEELKSVDQHIIDCEKSLLELKYRRDRLNVTLKELKDERLALLSFLSKPGALKEKKVVVPEPTPDPVPEIEPTTYKVGDFYDDGKKQGVVFDVSDDGKHGKIISLDVTALRWCSKLDSKSIGVTSKSDGQSNTDIVMSRNDYKNYPAFVWCREQGEDWYLPSKNELLSLYHVKNQINKLLRDRCKEMINDNWYWSSTERGYCAWFVDMNNGSTYNGNKFGNYYVRAVSAF